MADMTATAVAPRPTEALWLAPLPGGVSPDRSPARVTPQAATGVLGGLSGAVTDMAFSRDGRVLVAAHYGDDAVSAIDTETLTLRGVTHGVAEPSALAVSDRAYVGSAAVADDRVVAIDLATGAALADREIGATVRGLALSPSGDSLYVARCADNGDHGRDGADVAVIGVENGRMATIPVARGADAAIGAVRISSDGSRLYAALTTAAGSAIAVIDTRSRRTLRTIAVRGSVSDIAVHRDGARVIVVGWDAGHGGIVTVVDTAVGRAVATIAVGGQPTQVVTAGDRAYVARGEDVVVIDVVTARTVDTIATHRTVSCIAVSPDRTVLYAADYEGTLTATALAGSRLRAAS